LLSVSGSLRS